MLTYSLFSRSFIALPLYWVSLSSVFSIYQLEYGNLRIVIVTAYYYPLNVPRAFRATELAHEFARRGHQVTVINAITVLNSDGVLLSIDKTPNVKLINLHAFKWCIDSSKKYNTVIVDSFQILNNISGSFCFIFLPINGFICT